MEDKWKEIKSVAIYTAVMLVLFIFSLYGISRMQSCEGLKEQKRLVVIDTQVIVRYKDEVQRDTVYIWAERFIRKTHEPVKVLSQRVDSATAEEMKKADVMIRVEKAADELRIYAYNEKGEAVKEYIFQDVGRDFKAVSLEENIFVESNRWYWEGFRLKAGLDIQGMDFRTGYRPKVGVETGVEFQSKAGLEGGIWFDTRRKEFDLRVGINYEF